MAEHFKYYPTDEEVVTPWNARYSYPSQANKATKMTPRIPPKNGAAFGPGQIIRLEFPAQGYVNPLNTMLEFDVVLYGPVVTQGAWAVRFQNNIQTIFNRVRLLYGANPQEDLLQYGLLVRCLTEWTATNQMNNIDQGSISDGIGGTHTGRIVAATVAAQTFTSGAGDGATVTLTLTGQGIGTYPVGTYVTVSGATAATGYVNGTFIVTGGNANTITYAATGQTIGGTISVLGISLSTGLCNTRQKCIQGLQGNFTAPISLALDGNWLETNGQGSGLVPNSTNAMIPAGCPNVTGSVNVVTGANSFSVRRYMVNFALGLFVQDKLIPTKYMASQLAIEITLENAANCLYQPLGAAYTSLQPTYYVGNINLIPEIIEFDDTYDEQFLKGLESGGVPIKFSTWHYFQFTTQGASSLQLQITERSRSVKGIFAVQRRNPAGIQYDSHACLFDSNPKSGVNSVGSTMQQYQFRIGGRYFPAAPVQLSNPGGNVSNGGAEAYTELCKFLNIVGDSRLKTNSTVYNWAVPAVINQNYNLLPEYDFSYAESGFNQYGIPGFIVIESNFTAFNGNSPSCSFACAINFETSNGIEISGLNAEEQSDISFNVMWSDSQASGFSIECFTYVDVMWVLRPNNYLDLIQ